MDDVASPRRPLCEAKRQSRAGTRLGAVSGNVHMHRHVVACSTPTTEQNSAAPAFAQKEPSQQTPPDDRSRRQAIVPRRPGRRSLSSPGRRAADYRFGDAAIALVRAPGAVPDDRD
jgi:hypothetical protein